MKFELTLTQVSLAVILFVAIQFLVPLWISERFKAALQKENAIFLEKLRWEVKVREQAENVAESSYIEHGV